jgi:hypothetical protein
LNTHCKRSHKVHLECDVVAAHFDDDGKQQAAQQDDDLEIAKLWLEVLINGPVPLTHLSTPVQPAQRAVLGH